MADAHKNLAVSTVATAPSPAASGTSLVVASGHGARFPAVPFNATVWPDGELPDPSNAEIVRVTNISSDTLTITRAQEDTTARTIVVGDLIAATVTAKTLTDVEDAIANHLADTSDAHDASAVSFTPAGNVGSTDVQAAIQELDSEKAAVSHAHSGADITSGTVADARIASTIARDSEVTAAISASEAGQVRDGDAAGGVLSGTYPDPGFAADMATQAELDAHVSDATAAHAASAISYAGGTGMSATDVEAALDELATEKANAADVPTNATFNSHASSHQDGGSDEISIQGLAGTPAELTNHLNDTADAHDASAISNVPAGGIAATDVQAALNELDSEKADAASTVILAPASSSRNVIQPTDGTPLIVRAKSGQTDNLFQIEDSAASALIAVDSSGNMTLGQGTTGVNLKVIGATPLQVCANDGSESSWFKVGPSGVVRFNQGGGYTLCATASQTNTARMNIGTLSAVSCALAITGVSGQSGDLISVHPTTGSSTKYLRVNKGGYLMIRKTSAPADADLDSSEVAFWLDDSTGATKIMFKAKDSAGTVKTGSVTLT